MKDEQKKLITEIMNDDAKDGLYISPTKSNADMNIGVPQKTTAVEWFLQELIRCGWLEEGQINITLEQAKKREKEQRIKDYNVGYLDAKCNHINDAENYVNEQEYLNKTYGNKS